MNRGRAVVAGLVGWVLLGTGAFAQGWDGDQTTRLVPPTASARQSEYSGGVLAKVPVERLRPQVVQDPSGVRISVREVRKGVGDAQLWELRWEPGQAWGPGTWVAFRDGLGQLRELRVILLEATTPREHLLAQPGTWIRLVPQGMGGCRLDVFLAGRLVTGGWTVPASLIQVLTSDDAWLWETTSQEVDWASLVPSRRWEDEKVEALRTRMHKLLSTVPEASSNLWWPDPRSSSVGTAANGSPWGAWISVPGLGEGPVSRGLGPWGVTLWTATGVLRGWDAGFPTWNDLLEPRVELAGYSRALVREELSSDPGFALDWIRNLGLLVHRTLYPTRPQSDDSADVKDLPFLEPLPGAGYRVEDFPALAHLLAVTKPGQIYLISLSIQKNEKGTSSSVSYLAPAVLLPWVGEDHRVRVALYSGPRELSWDQWIAQAPLVRRGVRADHLAITALPLPPQVALPLLPAR